jgi:WD40 repeat protein
MNLPRILSATVLLASLTPPTLRAVDFHADVAPILRDYCAGCHSGKENEADLNLETFASLKTGGENGTPLPEKPGAESLLHRVIHGKKPAMPPKKEPQPSAAELAILDAWLQEGAPGPKANDVSILSLVTVPDLPLRKRNSPAITAAALSPDGRHLAVGRFQTVELLDAQSQQILQKFEGFEGKVTALAVSSTGRIAAASGVAGIRGRIRFFDPQNQQPVHEIADAHRDLVYSLRWSPDGSRLASGSYDTRIHLWENENRTRTLTGHNGAVFDLAFHPQGKLLASASADQTVKIWRVQDGERLDTLKEPQGEQFRVLFTPDGSHVLAAGADRRLRLWKLQSINKPGINPILETRFAHESAVTQMAFLHSGNRILTVAQDRSAKLWTFPQLDLDQTLEPQPESPTALLPTSDPALLQVTRMDGTLAHLRIPAPAARPQHAPLTPPETSTAKTDSKPAPVAEQEPNSSVAEAQPVVFPAEIAGRIGTAGDQDIFRFSAKKGARLSFEVFAAREKSGLDSHLEVLDAEGHKIERVLLQATRSSWLTFRGKDSSTSDDFRVQNYSEMELNEFLYCNGEVVKLWMYPRGPDSGFMVYPGSGARQTYFGTSPLAHPLGQPVYTVRPLPPGTIPPPTGLPLFPVHWENDDDPQRAAGHDSILHFTAPADAEYRLRISDVRGFGGDAFGYRLIARPSRPDFSLTLSLGNSLTVSPGSGAEFQLRASRMDEFDGPIDVTFENLPPGFRTQGPIRIGEGQIFAFGAIYADKDAAAPSPEAVAKIEWVGKTQLAGIERVNRGTAFKELKLGKPPKLTTQVAPSNGSADPVELVIHPGETISSRIRVDRIDFKDRVEFGKEDSGRNLPHGVYVDNLGLNGLLIPEGEVEREFFLTAAKWVPESVSWIFFRAKGDGGQATPPIRLRVVRN